MCTSVGMSPGSEGHISTVLYSVDGSEAVLKALDEELGSEGIVGID